MNSDFIGNFFKLYVDFYYSDHQTDYIIHLSDVDCENDLGKALDSIAVRLGQDPTTVRTKLVELIDNIQKNSGKTIDEFNKNREEALPQMIANVINKMDLAKKIVQGEQERANKIIDAQEAGVIKVIEEFRKQLPNMRIQLPKQLPFQLPKELPFFGRTKELDTPNTNELSKRAKREVSAEEVKKMLEELEEKPLDKKILTDLSKNKELFDAVFNVVENASKATSSVVGFAGAVANAGVDSLKTVAVHGGAGLNQFLSDRMREIKENIDKTANKLKKELAPAPGAA